MDVAAEPAKDLAAVLVERYQGRVVRRDDGIIAAFDGAARAVRCAEAIVSGHAVNGTVRAGLHSGECDATGDGMNGAAVRIARSMTRLAPADCVVVSQTVRDLVVDSGITFDDHGSHAVEGVPNRWRAYLVTGT